MKTKLIIVTLLHTTMPIVDTLLTLKTCCRFLLNCSVICFPLLPCSVTCSAHLTIIGCQCDYNLFSLVVTTLPLKRHAPGVETLHMTTLIASSSSFQSHKFEPQNYTFLHSTVTSQFYAQPETKGLFNASNFRY
jgi:hypothetical protein